MKEKNRGAKLWNPLTVLYMVLLLAVGSAIFSPLVTVATVVIMLGIAIWCGEGVGYFKLWIKSIFLICVICFIFQSLFIPGEEIIWEFWVFSIKKESLAKAITLCSRILGIGSAIILAGRLLDIKDLTSVLEEKGMSSSATYVLLSTTNIIPQMSKKMNAILEAQKSRGIEMESNMLVRAKAFFPSVGPLILNSVVSAEERAITLEARAFSATCKKTKLNKINDTKMDKSLRIIFVILVILMIGGKIAWTLLK